MYLHQIIIKFNVMIRKLKTTLNLSSAGASATAPSECIGRDNWSFKVFQNSAVKFIKKWDGPIERN